MDHISKVSSELRVGQIKMEEAPRRRPAQFKPTRASKLMTMRLAQLTTSGLMIVALTILFSHHIQPTSANAALSEVWSETDGLQVKYSTNHDDLLNSKGSEISLSSDQQNQRHTEPASGGESGEGQQSSSTGQEAESGSQSNGAEDSSSPSSEDSPSSSSTEGGSSSQEEGEQSNDQAGGSSEQGAADSRQTEKSVLPSMAGRVQSYSSSPSSKHSSSSLPSSKSHSGGHYRDVAEDSSRLQKSSSRPIDSPATFESLGPSFADSSSEAPAASEEQTSADEDTNDSPLSKEGPPKGSGAMRFRQPGRLFKEAVRITDNGDKRDQANAVAEDGDESSSPSGGDKSSKSSKSSSNDNDDDDDSDSSNEGSWGAPVSNRQSSGKKPNQEQNMIDYERPYGTKDSSADEEVVHQDNSEQMFRSAPAQAVGGGGGTRAHNQFVMNEDEDSSEGANGGGGFREQQASPRGPMYYDHSGRTLLAASSQKGQTHPFAGKSAATTPGAGSNQATDANKQPFKQLAYFRGLNADQASGLRQPIMRLNAVANQERAPDGSPDSVRDNFISPGHYPGSMPHLTQAASEIAQSAADIQSEKNKPVVAATVTTATAIKAIDSGDQKSPLDESSNDEQRTKSSSQESNSELNNGSDNNNSNKLTSDISRQQNPILSDTKTSDNVEQKQAESKEVVSIAVTPMPELQLESQQIMAPVLVSTTTIAPMPSTSAPPRSGEDDNKPTAATSTSTTSTTTKAPSLKRFKFRKYR